MICPKCQEQQHEHCDDVLAGEVRRYRSCNCQHRTRVEAEPATGPAGE